MKIGFILFLHIHMWLSQEKLKYILFLYVHVDQIFYKPYLPKALMIFLGHFYMFMVITPITFFY